jgi:hypothetical protein
MEEKEAEGKHRKDGVPSDTPRVRFVGLSPPHLPQDNLEEGSSASAVDRRPYGRYPPPQATIPRG